MTGITRNETKIDYSLKAKITSVTLNGEVTVKFSNPIYKPKEYEKYNDTHLEITFVKADGSKLDIEVYEDYNWTITDIHLNSMSIKLDFDKAREISMLQDKDYIQIRFK